MIGATTFRLDGRIALVTGSSTGIGLAVARGFAQVGARVVLNGRHGDRLARAAATLKDEGLQVEQRIFDVADPVAVQAAVTQIEASVGPLDILVNNAGITRRAPIHEMPVDDWRTVMATNVDAPFYVGRAVAAAMVPRRRGRILNVCSIMSDICRPGTSAYTTSKGALKMLTKNMAVDLAPHGITVNGIAPGYFRTELTASIAADPTFNRWIADHTPLGRWGQLEELAAVAVFLASDASSYINGHLLVVDGGMTATL